MTTPVHVLGISGSLRAASYNTGLLRAAAEVLPEGMSLEIFDLAPIPMYNQDLERDAPEAVVQLRARIAGADALLIATPEYNYSIPGVLKNALDWASRPRQASALNGKPLAMMGAGGRFGTVRAQLQLRQFLHELGVLPLGKPELMVPGAWEKFDGDGNLTHEPTREELRALLGALAHWTRRLRGH
jgi:chromate reductase, NAD(P)H dehydrogenase (quinone)